MCKVARQVGKRPRLDRVYAGRPSKWGNRFVISRDGSRDEEIAKIPRMDCAAAGTHGGAARTARQASRVHPSAVTPTCSSNSQTAEVLQPISIARGCGAMRHPSLAGCC